MKRPTSRSRLDSARTPALFAAVLLGLPIGCGSEEPAPETASVASPLISRADFYDGSQGVTMRVKTCDWVASTQPAGAAHKACAYCVVDPGFIRVGGGAEIQGQATPGARLKASFPADDPALDVSWTGCRGDATTDTREDAVWVARSSGNQHNLRAYVIGMKVTWANPTVRTVDRTVSTPAAPGIASVDCDSADIAESFGSQNFLVVGGGAEIVPETDDAYLTESRAIDVSGNMVWRAKSRLQQGTSPGGVKCYAIGVEPCSAGSDKCLKRNLRQITGTASTGYSAVNDSTPYPWVTTSFGAYAQTTGTNQRYLADLIPMNGINQGFLARMQNLNGTDSASAFGTSLSVRIDWPAPTYKIFYTHSRRCQSVLDARTDNGAPIVQQDCIWGGGEHQKFAMVPRPGGYLALRYSHSGQCVDVSGASVNNSAAVTQWPCHFGDNQLVQMVNDGAGGHSFKFKHSGKCLDVEGASLANNARLIQYTCNSQANQTFYFDD